MPTRSTRAPNRTNLHYEGRRGSSPALKFRLTNQTLVSGMTVGARFLQRRATLVRPGANRAGHLHVSRRAKPAGQSRDPPTAGREQLGSDGSGRSARNRDDVGSRRRRSVLNADARTTQVRSGADVGAGATDDREIVALIRGEYAKG
jgi:hypothetical protein